jgi:hypothetical protein
LAWEKSEIHPPSNDVLSNFVHVPLVSLNLLVFGAHEQALAHAPQPRELESQGGKPG